MGKVKVKIIGFSFSHRKGRNVAWMVKYALKAAEGFGVRIKEAAEVETEFVDTAGEKIRACLACDKRYCEPNYGLPYKGERPEFGCIIKNDYMARVLIPKLKEGDGFVFGSPVYGLSTSSQWRLFANRLTDPLCHGVLVNKPAAAIAVATMPIGGQETCLDEMNRTIIASEMLSANWPIGVPCVSGPPNGPLPKDDDGKVIGVKNDKYGKTYALIAGRRVGEIAVMLALAKNALGDTHAREFLQRLHPPYGDESWAWRRLGKEIEDSIMGA